MKYNLILGSHVKMNKKNLYLIGCVEESIKYGSNAFMFFSSSPRNTKKREIENENINEFNKLIKKYKINKSNIFIHASYIINLANIINPIIYKISKKMLESEIILAMKIGVKTLVLHPGSSLKQNRKNSIDSLINGLNDVLKSEYDIKIAIETMSGKGSEIGINFSEIKYIIDNVKLKEKVGVCWDTCHLHDAGYDLTNNLDLIIKDFENLIGLEKLLLIHLNDSKNIINSHKDRHENIGYGKIGFDTLIKIAYHKKLENIPKILETPWNNGKSPYKDEIENIKNKIFKKFKNKI